MALFNRVPHIIFTAVLSVCMLTSGLAGAEIDLAKGPTPRGFAAACARLGVDAGELSLAGGEDYELLFTLRSRASRMDCSRNQLLADTRLTKNHYIRRRIGHRLDLCQHVFQRRAVTYDSAEI